MKKSSHLYLELLEYSKEIIKFAKNTMQFHSFLKYNNFNELCINKMFKYNTIPRQDYFEEIPSLKEECAKCWNFYLNPRNKAIKKFDVIYGIQFENIFIKFLKSLGINSIKADKKNKILPDNLILNDKKNTIAYYEVKYHNAPFVKVFQYNKGRECYEGSITLDYSKVEKQINEIREFTSLPIYYLHWVDFPCIKGIFYMSLEDTKEILERGIDYKRKDKEGDYKITKNGVKKKISYQKKFYPSLFEMKNFEDFINLFSH